MITSHFHGHLKASLQPLSGVIKLTLPIETPVIHVQLSGRVGGTLPHKFYSSLSWVDQTANGHLHGQSPRSGFAVIGPFEPMPAGTGIAPPRCHPPPDGGTLRHVNNSLPGPLSEGSVHGNGSRQPDNWLSALAEPFVTVLAHGNGVNQSIFLTIISNNQTHVINGWRTPLINTTQLANTVPRAGNFLLLTNLSAV